jgi:hypothetical protein
MFAPIGGASSCGIPSMGVEKQGPPASLIMRNNCSSAFIVGVGIWLFGIFVKFPQGMLTTSHYPRLEDYLKLCANPFARDVNPLLAYRISIPTLAWALQLPPIICIFLPIFFLISAYAVVFFVISERTGDKTFSLVTVAGLSLTFFALWTNRWLGYPDAFSHLCSALALLSANPLMLALFCIFGTLNDERWVISVPFLLYWHGSNHAKAGIFNWVDATRAGIGIGIGLLFVFLVRHALTVGWLGPGIQGRWIASFYIHLVREVRDRLSPYNSTWSLFAINILMGLGWYWLAVMRLVARQLSSPTQIWGFVLGLSIFTASLSTILVEDVSRSVGFSYLIVVIASVYDYDAGSASAQIWWRNLLIATALTPTIYYTGLSGAVFIPFPIDLINHILHQYGGADLLENLKLWFRFN